MALSPTPRPTWDSVDFDDSSSSSSFSASDTAIIIIVLVLLILVIIISAVYNCKKDEEVEAEQRQIATVSKGKSAVHLQQRAAADNSDCPGSHGLTKFNTTRDGYHCDVCRKKLREGDAMYGCRTCDYDECPECYRTTERVKSAMDCDAVDGPLSKEQTLSKYTYTWSMSFPCVWQRRDAFE